MNSEVAYRCSKSYFVSLPGLTRFGLILAQIGSMVSAAALKVEDITLVEKLEKTWSCTIAFNVIGVVVSLAIFILNIFKIPKKHDFERLMDIIIVISDALLGITMIALGIACAVRESQIEKLTMIDKVLNIGAFGAAGALALLAAIFYVISFTYHLMKLVRPNAIVTKKTKNNDVINGPNTNVTSTAVNNDINNGLNTNVNSTTINNDNNNGPIATVSSTTNNNNVINNGTPKVDK